MSEPMKPTDAEVLTAMRWIWANGFSVFKSSIGGHFVLSDGTSWRQEGGCPELLAVEFYRKKTKPTPAQMGEFLMRTNVQKFAYLHPDAFKVIVYRNGYGYGYESKDHDEAIIQAMRAEGVA